MAGAKQALTRAARYSVERQQFGRSIAEFGLIRQKLGEMAVRCFVGDAMVYRTLGAVDRALEQIPDTDTTATLKAIEGFAVECSINKVWTSEALAFVVDEALQVYGGYGYSQEFPAERAYRDARITRIYEGTNEINRLIIPTRLLKNPLTAHLFESSGMRSTLIDSDTNTSVSIDALEYAHQLLSAAKRLVIYTLTSAKEAFGSSLNEEQEVLGHIADIVIDTYALESVILRTEKLFAARQGRECEVPLDITNVFAMDAADRLAHSTREVMNAAASDDDVLPLIPVQQYNNIAARRRIADSVIKAGRYQM
jgi:butyryl-CoA dehydrogenase